MRRRVISVLAAALAAALVLAVPASAWEYASGNGYIIRERVEEDGAHVWDVSANGRDWLPTDRMPREQAASSRMFLLETGGAVVRYDRQSGSMSYWNGTEWSTPELDFDPLEGLDGTEYVYYDLACSGDSYLLRQYAIGNGDKVNREWVVLLDGAFQQVAEHDFGAPVTDLAYIDGAYYVLTLWEDGYKTYRSSDGRNWALSGWSVFGLPEPRPEKPATAKTLVPGDETDGWLIYRMNGGPLQVSVDGVYFRTLDPWNAVGLKVYGGQGGAVLVPTDKLGIVTSGKPLVVDDAEQAALLRDTFGPSPTYVALDGKYFSLTDRTLRTTAGCTMAPLRELAIWMGYYDFSYDAATGTAVCNNGVQTITVRVGSTRGQVSGRGQVPMAVPPELVGWKVYVPVRFMVDAAGLEDVWDAEQNTLWITTPEQA
ncbi:copper amine oxidase N-terminal domain-containing protein [Lawsonibacter hominis]|uniref:Copper amine oxidase N-terminal domain-containing protein n=1 Tax=Lawsonibacter hominis TaxID=2763053 RepID=A0A8J6JAT3_9FIRM|nr:copper amine oxidase N-terminal domain-containing protein [Lawsonibacter hominis]MBC5732323.1 copper amine oxidase N-terminal domain-containing protein [Lawsonibacter hominis]